MSPIVDPEEIQGITQLVERYLERHQPQDRSYRLKVVKEGLQREDDWIYVVVLPDRDDIRSYDYAARLAETEGDIEENEHRKVLLVPALPN